MNILSIILSIYITCLILIPCSDIEHNDSNNIVTMDVNSEYLDKHTNDLCTPFCTCTCCHTNVILNEITVVNNLESPIFNISQYSSYFDMETKSYHSTLFHPPIR